MGEPLTAGDSDTPAAPVKVKRGNAAAAASLQPVCQHIKRTPPERDLQCKLLQFNAPGRGACVAVKWHLLPSGCTGHIHLCTNGSCTTCVSVCACSAK